MTEATAYCTCKIFGKRFIKKTVESNHMEAVAWETWAVEHYNIFGRCLNQKNQNTEFEMLISLLQSKGLVVVRIVGPTSSIKGRIKSMGYEYGIPPHSSSHYSSPKRLCCYKAFPWYETEQNIENILKEAEELGLKVKNSLEKIDWEAYKNYIGLING